MPLAATLIGAAVLASCAGSAAVSERPGVLVPGDKLTVYSSAPLSGESRQSGEALVNGQRLALVDAESRIHTTFVQAAAATGRLASINPNMQNIPVRTELGREIRGCFEAASRSAYES